MRIAMIGQKGIPAIYGGVEQHVQDLSMRLVKLGHEVTVYSRGWYTGKSNTQINGVQTKNIFSIHTKHLDTISHTFLCTINAIWNKFDVIHYHGVGPALLSWLPRILSTKTKVIVTFHSIDRYHQKWGWFAKFILRLGEWSACRFPHETITVSKGLYNYCLNEFKKETIYIPNGVEIVPAQDDSFITRFGLEKNQYLLMVSRLVPHKGAHVLINAFLNFKKQNPDNKLKLVIAGGSVHTDKYCAALHELAANRGDIVFTDFVSNQTLNSLYSNASALVHPSFNEGLPFSVLQAMSFSRPVLLSAIEAHLELNKNSEIFFKENNVSDLKNKINEFASWNDAKKQKLGETNQKMVMNNYNWNKIADQTSLVYNTLDRKTGLCYNTL